MKSAHKKAVLGKVIIYAILILIAVVMIIPFLWMLSASIKSIKYNKCWHINSLHVQTIFK